MLSKTTRAAGILVLTSILGCASEEPAEYFDLVTSFARASIHESPEGVPRTDVEARLLFLPAGSAVTYSFEGYRESSLVIGRVTTRGEGSELSVTLSSDRERSYFEYSVGHLERAMSIELPFEAPRGQPVPLSLTLKAGSASAAQGDGVLLTRPTIRGLRPKTATAAAIAFEKLENPNVVIYLIDSLRRDRLGTYGYDRPVSPNIDEFAQGATVFENGVGQSSWTKPSVASIFSGVWPPVHQATSWSHRLPGRFDTLAEVLRAAGYQTAAFVTNPNINRTFGFDQGFEHFWLQKKLRSDLVNEEVVSWLNGGRDQAKPLFLYVHTMDPHAAYRPAEPYRSRFAPTADQMKPWRPRWRWPVENLPFFSDLYDGEIAQNDAAFGELIEALRDRELFESSLIFVLADHGEEFREHGGWRHGRVLNHGSLDVPMIVKFPGQQKGGRSALPASHVDVMPTVLDVAGLAEQRGIDGQSLAMAVERPVFSHLRLGRAGEPGNVGALQYSVVDGHWKLIQVHGKHARTELFDLDEDPGETKNLADELPVRTALLEGLLRQRLALSQEGEAEGVELTDELQDSLRALGYLQ